MDVHEKYDLKEHGVCILKNVLTLPEIEQFKQLCIHRDYKSVKTELLHNEQINQKIQGMLQNEGYQFQDYIWVIEKSSVHTCHRDNNGDFFNPGQKYPSYTMLVYLEDMDKCLGVIPTSHRDAHSYGVNFTDPVVHLLCNKGDIILFNANLIHVGTILPKDDHLRIQMKITHKDDIPVLSYYENYNKVLKESNPLPTFLKKGQKNISCMLPILSTITQGENIRSARGSDNGAQIGVLQKIFSFLFYGKSDYYDLPNAFSST